MDRSERRRYITRATAQSETRRWEINVRNNGGTTTSLDRDAVNWWFRDLKNRGLLQKLAFLWSPPSATDFAGAAIALIHPNANGKITLTNFVAGDLSSQGLLGNGSTKYADLGFIPATIATTTSVTIGLFCHTSNVSAVVDMGVDDTGVLHLENYSGTLYFDSFDFSAGRITVASADSKGLVIGTRASAIDTRIYQNKTQLQSGAGSGGAIPATRNLFAWATNLSGTPSYYSNRAYSLLFAGGSAFSVVDRDSFYDSYAGYAARIGRSLA